MQGRKNRENYVRLGKSIAKGKQGICLESDIENSISVQKEIYEARLTNSSTGGNGVPRIIIIPRTGRYHIKVRGASGGYGAHAKYLGYEPGSGASIEADFELKAGDELTVVVGQCGGDSMYANVSGTTDGATGGGGGGTFVFKKILEITDTRYQFTKAGSNYEVLLVAAGGSGTPDCRNTNGQKNGFNGIASIYYSPDNFVGYSTTTNGTTNCNSITHWINNDLIGISGGYSADKLVYGGYGGGSQGGDDKGYFGGGWSSAYTATYYETTEDEITQTTTNGWYMGQSWSFSSGEYTKGKNGVTGQAVRHGAFEIHELIGEGLIKTEGTGKEKYLSDNGKYEEVDAIKSLSISGRTISYKKRDGTQGALVTQDTNTHYTARLYVGGNTGGSNASTSNGSTYLKLYENGTVRDSKLIKGTGITTVTSDSTGNISVNTQIPKIVIKEGLGTMAGIGGTVYFQVIGECNESVKIVKIKGTLSFQSYSTSDTYKYRIINPSSLGNKLGITGLSTNTFKKGWWWGTRKSGSSLDLIGYGTGISRQDTSYLGLGRIYDPSSGGLYGNWAQDTFQNHMQDAEAFFEIWFDYTSVSQ